MSELFNFDEVINRENTESIKWDGRKTYFGTENVLPMWVADMDFKVAPSIVDAVNKKAKTGVYGYSLRPPEYYSSFMDWLKRRHQWQINKEWILFSPGIVPALNIAIQTYTRPGDKVLVQPPVYHPFFFAVENNYRELVYNPLVLRNGRYYIDFDDLEQKLSGGIKLLLLSNPQNPTGRSWSREELQSLGEMCVRYNTIMVSDDIHADLMLPGYEHTPLASISEPISQCTITCMAPSKTFNLAGLATSSVIISNPDLRKTFNTTLDQIHVTMGNLFGTVASIAAYTHGDNWLDQLMTYLQGNIKLVKDYLEEFIPKVKMIQPDATYLLWLDFRNLGLDPEVLKKLLIQKAGLGFNDGRTYRTGGEGFQRMNVACPRLEVKKAMNRLRSTFENL